jgi:hypothetical protein
MLEHPSGKYIKTAAKKGIIAEHITAFRLEIKEKKNLGYLDIDGEAYIGTAIQGCLSEHTVNIIS